MTEPVDPRRSRPPAARTVVYRFEARRVGGLQGLALLLVALAALAVLVVVGIVAFAVALWVGLAVALGLIVFAALRALLGPGRR